MTLRQIIQAAPEKAAELITKLSATSNQAVKTREGLFAQLSDELVRYVELEEQHLLPLLRKHPDTKDLAAGALKGNKDLRASLAKLSGMPKDSDAFLAELGELNKGFQQHVRNERKELLPAVLKALSDEEAEALVNTIEGAAADAEQAKRDEKREERAQAKREAEEAEQAAAEQRAAVRAQKAAERSAREATEKVVDTIERGAASVQDSTRQVTANITERAQRVASETRDAMTVYSESTQKLAGDWQAVRASSATSVEALSEVRTAWTEWFGKATRLNAEASQQLLQCRSVKQVAELQREFVTTAMRNWMEASTKVLETTQHSSKQALRPLDERLNEAV
jgi:hypothetical protein